ncbi:MAG: glycosyltransferase family 2 protein [Candidatus Omnitrophica bacterium]|nr:glycosyltransferase family 2 protein [Candidatus Omnitrophota bacterium]
MKNTILASIIIPTFNRCFLLEKTVVSLVNQIFDYDKFEIIVIDNGSTDETKSVVGKLTIEHPQHTIRYIYDDVPGLLTGRHRGAKEANSDILCFVDDDIEAAPCWLQAICDDFKDPNVHLVGGKCLPIYDVPPPEWEKSLWSNNNDLKMCLYYSLIDQGDVKKGTDPNYIFGLNFCIRRQVLLNLGGFHPDCIPKRLQKYQGDGETGLTMMFAKKGLRAMYDPKALVYHHVTKERLTMEYLESRMFYNGVGYSYFLVRNHCKPILVFRLLLRAIKIRVRGLLRCSKDAFSERMRNAYQRGFDFHQSEIKNDPKLIGWIKKENYFDYSLPV